MLEEAKVGLIVASDSTVNPVRTERTGGIVVQDAHAKYYEPVSRGAVFLASMQAGAALGTALTATAVTFTLYNPSSSGVNVAIIQCGIAITTAPAGSAAYVYAINAIDQQAPPATVTALTVRSAKLSVIPGKALAYSVATLPATPQIARVHSSITATASACVGPAVDNVDGLITLAPGTMCTIQCVGTATSGIVSMVWEEIPL